MTAIECIRIREPRPGSSAVRVSENDWFLLRAEIESAGLAYSIEDYRVLVFEGKRVLNDGQGYRQ